MDALAPPIPNDRSPLSPTLDAPQKRYHRVHPEAACALARLSKSTAFDPFSRAQFLICVL
jgi:hypothetical protein